MFKIRILSRDDVAKSLTMSQIIETVENVYKSKSEGSAIVWPTVFYEFDPGKSDMDIKSGYLKNAGRFGHKTVSWFGANEAKGLPTLIGTLVIYDASTGAPVGVMDASYITGMRTGAAGAIGAKYLARGGSENLLMVGAGNQAIFQIAATLTVFPGIKKVMVAARDFAKTGGFVKNLAARLAGEFRLDVSRVSFEAVSGLKGAVGNSDIIITATNSTSPVIKKEWVKAGAHFSCIGADMPGKEEIDPEIFASARVFADDKEHCMDVGEMAIPLKKGIIKEKDITGEMGDLLLGQVRGRVDDKDITIFDSTGMAILDIASGGIALQQAAAHGFGSEVMI